MWIFLQLSEPPSTHRCTIWVYNIQMLSYRRIKAVATFEWEFFCTDSIWPEIRANLSPLLFPCAHLCPSIEYDCELSVPQFYVKLSTIYCLYHSLASSYGRQRRRTYWDHCEEKKVLKTVLADRRTTTKRTVTLTRLGWVGLLWLWRFFFCTL